MLNGKQEIFYTATLISLFFIALIIVIVVTAILYNNRKRIHKIDVSNFQQTLLQTQHEVQEQTMQTIGADLHDNIGQLLSLTSLTLNSIEFENAEKARQKVDAAIDLTLRSIKEMRLLGKLLQGDQLVSMGLPEAIRHEINWLEKSGKYQITYLEDGEMSAANDANKDLILFRILQEILNNIIKHAQATHIGIRLTYNEAVLQMQITDNGVGFDMDKLTADKRGMGLLNIQKRAGIIGGEAVINTKPGEGTCIDIFIPYP